MYLFYSTSYSYYYFCCSTMLQDYHRN